MGISLAIGTQVSGSVISACDAPSLAEFCVQIESGLVVVGSQTAFEGGPEFMQQILQCNGGGIAQTTMTDAVHHQMHSVKLIQIVR